MNSVILVIHEDGAQSAAPCPSVPEPADNWAEENARSAPPSAFRTSVLALRSAWEERRALERLAGAYDFHSRYQLFAIIHRWAEQLRADIDVVYGASLAVSLDPLPDETHPQPSFQIRLGEWLMLEFRMEHRRNMERLGWMIAGAIRCSTGPGGTAAAGPDRRSGIWTRARVEELVLSLVASYERSQGAATEQEAIVESAGRVAIGEFRRTG